MKVIAIERGPRPDLSTKARVIAPQAAKYLAEQLEPMTFADATAIMVDWTGDSTWTGNGEMPADLRIPIMVIICEKRFAKFPEKVFRVDYVLELEDFFGQDNATKDDLHEIISNLEKRIREEEKEKGL